MSEHRLIEKLNNLGIREIHGFATLEDRRGITAEHREVDNSRFFRWECLGYFMTRYQQRRVRVGCYSSIDACLLHDLELRVKDRNDTNVPPDVDILVVVRS